MEISWDEVEQRGRYLVAPDGSLWRRQPGMPGGGRTTRDFRYAITVPEAGPPGIAWFERSVHPAPQTAAELDERERRSAQAAKVQEAERVQQLKRLRARAQPVAVALLDPSLPRTLRGMVARIDSLGGRVEAVNGRLVLSLPPNEMGEGKFGVRIACWLYRAEAELLASGKNDGAIDPAKGHLSAHVLDGRKRLADPLAECSTAATLAHLT